VTALLVTVLAASLVGSLHCVGMCGPFVAFYSGADGSSGAGRLLSHAVYSGGRLVAYLLLGLAAGAIGAALDLAGALAGVQRVAAVVAGVVMVAWGVIALLRIRGFKIFTHSNAPLLAGWSRRAFAFVGERPPLVRAASVGLLSGVLPCGWLWAFLVTAAGTGSSLSGAAVMAAFWLGTVPALVAVGLGAQLIGAPLRRHVPALTAVLLVALGVFAILARPASVKAAISTHEHSQRMVPSLSESTPYCCAD
jgi:sulfite exporter TauE/SafE